MTYTPATQDQLLAIRVNAGIQELAQSEKFAAAEPDMVEAIVEGVGQFAAGEFAPLNLIGDLQGARLANGVVTLPDGFAEAYANYVEQGWNAIASPEEFGGQGLPFTLACNVLENLGTANMAFNLLPMSAWVRLRRWSITVLKSCSRNICPIWSAENGRAP